MMLRNNKLWIGIFLGTLFLTIGLMITPIISFGKKIPYRKSKSPLKKMLVSYQTKLVRSGAECELKSQGTIPQEVAKQAFAKCKTAIQQKYQECSKAEGWHLDIQIDVQDRKGREEFDELVCRGGCPGKGAGDSFPLYIKSEALDIKNTKYDIICSASCSRWKCDEVISPNISFSILDYKTYKESACTEQNSCSITLKESGELSQAYELIFAAPEGIRAELYPLKAWIRPPNSAWGQEVPLKNLQMACGEISQDGKSCNKTSGPITFHGAHPETYAVTLFDNKRNILFEGKTVLKLTD